MSSNNLERVDLAIQLANLVVVFEKYQIALQRCKVLIENDSSASDLYPIIIEALEPKAAHNEYTRLIDSNPIVAQHTKGGA